MSTGTIKVIRGKMVHIVLTPAQVRTACEALQWAATECVGRSAAQRQSGAGRCMRGFRAACLTRTWARLSLPTATQRTQGGLMRSCGTSHERRKPPSRTGGAADGEKVP